MAAGMRFVRGVAAATVVGGLVAGGYGVKRRHDRASEVTYAGDVAAVVFRRCAGCHRPGEVGPFSLLTYDDVADRADQIATVTASGYMPPWKPIAGDAELLNERRLSPAELELLRRWARAGAPRGDPSKEPPAPRWPDGWQLGEPSVVVSLTAPYTLPPEGRDAYRNFVIPSPVTAGRWVRAWEFRAGSRTIHHAILNVDRTGAARKLDEADPEPGYAGMGGAAQSPDGFYLVWTPGQTPSPGVPGSSWRLDDRTDLVLELHLKPTGKPETIQPRIGLFFADGPPARPRISVRIGDLPIDIPPGLSNYTRRDSLVLPADTELLALFPHAHYVARSVRTWAELPDGTRRSLVRIDDWDPSWQEEYTFKTPILLPKGSTVAMEFSYDNSEANVRNPNRPPKRIQTGERTTDEMGNVTLQLMPRDPRDHVVLKEAKYRWELQRADSASANYNLANTLAEEGKRDEAVALYRRATELDPSLPAVHYNLARLLRAQGDVNGAIAAYRRALELGPSCGAYTNLGTALAATGKAEEALTQYRAAIAADPRCAPAHNNLAVALLERGDAAGAIQHFEQALAVEPDNARSLVLGAKALATVGRTGEAGEHLRHALAVQPDFPEARAALEALPPAAPRAP